MICRIRQGEREFLDPLVDRYYKDIFQFCYYKTGDEQTACDCTQETFLRMLRFLDSYVERHKFRSYLLRIALNVCRDYYRANAVLTVPLTECGGGMPAKDGWGQDAWRRMPGGVSGGVSDGRMSGEGEFAGELEEAYVIQQCLMRLPEFQREAIILHFYYGYKVREIASITGVALPTAKSRIRQGLEKLRKIFREEDLYEERG